MNELPLAVDVEYIEPDYAYWSDVSGKVFAFAKDGSQDEFKADNLVLMADEEKEAHLNPTPLLWTNGENLREAFAMDLPGWKLASEAEIKAITHSDAIAAVALLTAELRSEANREIAPLQDALDLDEITDSKRAKLVQWKRYRIALSEIPEQPGYPEQIEFPTKP